MLDKQKVFSLICLIRSKLHGFLYLVRLSNKV
jgi:hypothetical protein